MRRADDYDPMIYDVMRESANRLVGEYTYLAHRAENVAVRHALLDAVVGVRREIHMVDIDSREAVEAETDEFSRRAGGMRTFRIGGVAHPESASADCGMTSGPIRVADIFDRFIAPSYGAVPSSSPVLCMVGAQPGAGKTREVARVASARPEAVEVSGDDLRAYHPDYAAMMDDDAICMPDLTREVSGAWVRMSLEYLRAHGMSAIVETTFAHPEANEDTLSLFRCAGYRVILMVVSTPAPLSLLGILERYAGQVESCGSGRWVDPSYHDWVVRCLPDNVARLIRGGSVDEAVIVEREGRRLLDESVVAANGEPTASRVARALRDGLSADGMNRESRRDAESVLRGIEGVLCRTEGDGGVDVSRTLSRLLSELAG